MLHLKDRYHHKIRITTSNDNESICSSLSGLKFWKMHPMRTLDQTSSIVSSSCDVLLNCVIQQEKARQSGQHNDQGWVCQSICVVQASYSLLTDSWFLKKMPALNMNISRKQHCLLHPFNIWEEQRVPIFSGRLREEPQAKAGKQRAHLLGFREHQAIRSSGSPSWVFCP